MVSVAVFGNSSSFVTTLASHLSFPKTFPGRTWVAPPPPPHCLSRSNCKTASSSPSARIVLDSLRVLEWDKLCDSVASFAATSLGKKAIKDQLWSLNKTYDDSLSLLQETNAMVEMYNYGAMVDFVPFDAALVESAIQYARRDSPVTAAQSVALVTLLQFAQVLQFNLKAAIKKDAECYQRFMPLSQRITELVVNGSLIKFIQQLIDEDGYVRDSASSALRHFRDQVRFLETKLRELMESMIRNEMSRTSSLEVSNMDGRWCIKSSTKLQTSFDSLMLSSGSGAGSILEPLSAVPLNDELQRARASVAKAEADVLLKITKKMQVDLIDTEVLFKNMIELDVVGTIKDTVLWLIRYMPRTRHG